MAIFVHRVSPDHHLTIELCNSNTSNRQDGANMLRAAANRGGFVRAVAVLCVALMCAMGTIQATHTHAENSTTSHHSCSICATAHAGFNTQTVASAPVLRTAALTTFVAEAVVIFRPATTQFIRPPPAL